MRKNIEFIKRFLDVFVESNRAYITTSELIDKGFIFDSDEVLFHFLLLVEEGYLSSMDLDYGDPKLLGVQFNRNTRSVLYNNAPIRLTSRGMDFFDSLNNPDVFERLKQLGDQPMSVLKDVGAELLKSYAKKKFGLE